MGWCYTHTMDTLLDIVTFVAVGIFLVYVFTGVEIL